MPEEAKQPPAGTNQLQLDARNMRTTYANTCRVAQTPNEIILDFGLNLVEPVLQLEARIVLSPDAAKRILIALANALQQYETNYGVIELDPAKRLKRPA